MSKTDSYFQFPIGVLRFDKPIDQVTDEEMKTRLFQIMDYCIIEVSYEIVRRNNDAAVAAQCERYVSKHSLKVDMGSKHVKIYICGADTLNVPVPFVDGQSGLGSWNSINNLPGGRKQLRLRADILREAINGEWRWRELATLCAVYAGIGASKMAKLSFDYIATMSLGYSSKAELKLAGHAGSILAMHKTRWTVNALFDRGLFAKASANGRHMWYTNSMNLIGLANALVNKKNEADKPSSSMVTRSIQARTQTAKPKVATTTRIMTEADTARAQREVINELRKIEKEHEAYVGEQSYISKH